MRTIAKNIGTALLAMAVLIGCGTAPSKGPSYDFTPGTYEGEGQGFGGPVKITVTVSSDRIESITITEHSETPGIGSVAVEQLPGKIIEAQSLGIDAISGCTVTSNAIFSGVKAALASSGVNLTQLTAAPSKAGAARGQSIDMNAQYVVVGAGGAGLTAAIAAAQQGVQVLVLEKMTYPGGATAMSGGGTAATGSKWQKAAGVTDTPEWLFMDMLLNGHFYNDPRTTWLFANTAGPSFDWLVDPAGAAVPYSDRLSGPSAEHRVGRSYSAVGGGPGMVDALVKRAEAVGVEFMYSTRAEELIVENGRITGVIAGDGAGNRYRITAGAVLLATGGYGANDKYVPAEVRKLPYAGSVSATGDGLEMAIAAGAATFNLDKINIQPHSIRLPDGRGQHTFQGCRYVYSSTGGILVSQDGVRIVNENASNYDILQAMLPQKQCFMIMDDPTYKQYIQTAIASRNFTQAQADEWLAANGTMTPIFASGDTLEALARTIGAPPAALAGTVANYTKYVAAGKDPDFGRTPAKALSSSGPYYAVAMDLRYYATLGGIRINELLEVVDSSDKTLPGLYAAGEIVAGVNGDIYTSSTCVGWAVTSGYQAGLQAAKALK
ncbi:FAD-dependent oxidoreductase [Breznakiella homolactica]|uniref:FAD-dependent oxidoreductase n=1 Tax=Breznakiella homolactica TaxID=2798577 RepID=A0A7T8BBH0_9SPIR|nr:FAD-dependent oxidoreductase [Breznakiella homolactica]QQO10025.1 FAD-dependent oxidoreductase [Breznakiella homolactica]